MVFKARHLIGELDVEVRVHSMASFPTRPANSRDDPTGGLLPPLSVYSRAVEIHHHITPWRDQSVRIMKECS